MDDPTDSLAEFVEWWRQAGPACWAAVDQAVAGLRDASFQWSAMMMWDEIASWDEFPRTL